MYSVRISSRNILIIFSSTRYGDYVGNFYSSNFTSHTWHLHIPRANFARLFQRISSPGFDRPFLTVCARSTELLKTASIAFLCVSIWSERLTACPLNLSRACSLSINKVPRGYDVRQFDQFLPLLFRVAENYIKIPPLSSFPRAAFSTESRSKGQTTHARLNFSRHGDCSRLKSISGSRGRAISTRR